MRLQQTIIESGIPRVIFYEGSRMDRTAYSFVLDFYRPLYDVFLNRLLANLKKLINSEQICEDLYEAIHSEMFFDRFKKILEHELDQTEKRLIILYFVNTAIVLPDHSLQVIYQNNIFDSFNFINDGQCAES